MNRWNRDNTILIMASTGFAYTGGKNEGFKVFHPYKGRGILSRLAREIGFRLPFMPKKIWYEKDIKKESPLYVVIWDTLITADYLLWLKRLLPEARIYFVYSNMIGKAKHLVPGKIPDGISVWTYDEYDSEKYGIKLYKNYMYYPSFVKPKQPPEYDVFFIGKDKGRAEFLLELERQMNGLGLKTKFIITADGRLSPRKKYYQAELAYAKVVDCITKSRSILNVVMENQKGVTLRDSESVFFNTKLITTNEHIVHKDFYNRNNVFILGKQNLADLPAFLGLETVPADSMLLEKHTIDGMISEMVLDN